ncbi:MAG TPA: hypothetical protein VHR72_13425 [Gemmataceae bacterium]|jgi:hypothetical protein|nr:hypothetical protein [Gemmataceae bacterium]
MSSSVLPVAKTIYLCDRYVGYPNGKVDLNGLFNSVRPFAGYPYRDACFCVFAQLINGLGNVPFHFDIRFAATDELIWTSGTNELFFATRFSTVQVAMTIEGCLFPHSGLYRVELFCDNTWVCDSELSFR